MPKKRQFSNLRSFQGVSSDKQAKDANNAGPSVNERLAELRKLEGKDAVRKRRELAESTSHQASVHPSLSSILGIPESAPPKPKRGVRTRIPHRTPGPAPPRSWGKTSWTPVLALRGKRFGKAGRANDERSRPKELLRFARLTGLEPDAADRPPTLLHLALKTAASQWELFEDEDLPILATELPLPLRLRLLSYLGFYGPSVEINVLEALTRGSEPVKSMDLAGLIHGKFTMDRVVKLSKQLPAEESSNPSPAIVESWDQDGTFEAALTMAPLTSRFSQLTHLSLSHPTSVVYWRDLLSLTKHTPSITHLSLAYWSRPTLTPNLATTTVASRHSPDVTAGGSHFYSALDQDLSEPASVLRQLSVNLLYLQWLDLEGCTEWIPALASYEDLQLTDGSSTDAGTADPWPRQAALPSMFTTTWKNVTTIRAGQGWLPTIPGLRALPRQTMPEAKRRCLDDYTSSFDTLELRKAELDEADIFGVQKGQADVWLEIEERAIAAGKRINILRRAQACKPIIFDHGWVRKTF